MEIGSDPERPASWALLAQLARLRGAASSLPGCFAPEVDGEYRRLRAELERLREVAEQGRPDPAGHERLRERARALLRRVEVAGDQVDD